MVLFHKLLISKAFSILYCSTFLLTSYNLVKMAEEKKIYPARDVKYWFGPCPPLFEYRSTKK